MKKQKGRKKTIFTALGLILLVQVILMFANRGKLPENGSANQGEQSGLSELSGPAGGTLGQKEGMGIDGSTTPLELTICSPVQSFQADKNLFRQSFPNGKGFFTSLPDGMLTNGGVKLVIEEGLIFELYKGDRSISYQSGNIITDPGNYVLRVISLANPMLAEDRNHYSANFKFRILSGAVNDITSFIPPEGFVVKEAGLNGKRLPFRDGNHILIEQDGLYLFVVESTPVSGLRYDIRVEVDTAPPDIVLTGVLDGQEADSGVSFASTDAKAVFKLYDSNGDERMTTPGYVSEPGSYTLTATDPWGNTRMVSFTILRSYKMPLILLLAGLAVAAAASFLYVFFIRRTFTVR